MEQTSKSSFSKTKSSFSKSRSGISKTKTALSQTKSGLSKSKSKTKSQPKKRRKKKRRKLVGEDSSASTSMKRVKASEDDTSKSRSRRRKNKKKKKKEKQKEEEPQIELLHAIVNVKKTQKVGKKSKGFGNKYKPKYLAFIANGKILAQYINSHQRQHLVERFQFVSNYEDFIDSPKNAEEKLTMKLNFQQCVLQFRDKREKQMWLDLLRYMNDKPPRGKLLALKHMIEADGMDFWFEFSALPYELACHVQRQGERQLFSKDYLQKRSGAAYLEVFNYFEEIAQVDQTEYLATWVSDSEEVKKKQACIILTSSSLPNFPPGCYKLTQKTGASKELTDYMDLTLKIDKIEICQPLMKNFSFIVHQAARHTRLFFDTVGEMFSCKRFIEEYLVKEQEKKEAKKRKKAVVKKAFRDLYINNFEKKDSKASSDEGGEGTAKNRRALLSGLLSNLKKPKVDKKSTKSSVFEKAAKMRNMTNRSVSKLTDSKTDTPAHSRLRREPTQTQKSEEKSKNKSDLVAASEQDHHQADYQDNVFGILKRRRGDSFAIFQIVAKTKSKFWTYDDKYELQDCINRWQTGLEWCTEIERYLADKRYKESLDLFQQCYSLELSEFCLQSWNEHISQLCMEDLIIFETFIEMLISSCQIFKKESEQKLPALLNVLSYSIESAFLNQFSIKLASVLNHFFRQENFDFDGKRITNRSFMDLASDLNNFLLKISDIGAEAAKQLKERVFKLIGYIITENFAILLNEKYSIEELYLIYSFLESFLDYFRIQTRAYKIKYTFFDHLTSMMNLTLINIENHLRQYIEDLEEDYYNSDNLEFLIQFLSDRFCYVKYLSKTLKQKVWYMILRHVTQLYISNYFKKESFDISPLALAEKINELDRNCLILRKFFEGFVRATQLNEMIYKIMYIAKIARASDQRAISDTIKHMIDQDMINSYENLSNVVELKSKFVKDPEKMKMRLKVINDERISKISTAYPDKILKISNKVFMQYICYSNWVYFRRDYTHKIFHKKKEGDYKGYTKLFACLVKGKIRLYLTDAMLNPEKSFNIYLIVEPKIHNNTELYFVYENEDFMFKFEDYKLRNLWMASIMTLTEHSYEPLNSIQTIYKERNQEIMNIRSKDGLICHNFVKEYLCHKIVIQEVDAPPLAHLKDQILKDFIE